MKGTYNVTDVAAAENVDAERVLACAASIAYFFHEPFFRAIVDEARYRGISPIAVEKVERVPGFGLQAFLDGALIQMGSEGIVEKINARGSEIFRSLADLWKNEGKKIVWVIAGGVTVGVVGIFGSLYLPAPTHKNTFNFTFRSFASFLSKYK
jgi:Cu+-exporting ATPase